MFNVDLKLPCVCVDHRWRGTGKKMVLSTRGVLESSNGAPSGGLVKKRWGCSECCITKLPQNGKMLPCESIIFTFVVLNSAYCHLMFQKSIDANLDYAEL